MKITTELIENIKTQFIQDTSYYLPEFNVIYSVDDNGWVEYNKTHILKLPKNITDFDKHTLIGFFYHEFTHLCDDKIFQTFQPCAFPSSVISEVHASYIEMKYLSKHLSRFEIEAIIDNRKQSALDFYNDGNAISCFRCIQYICGFLKCLNENSNEYPPNQYLKGFNTIYGDTLKPYYDSLNFPFTINQETLSICFNTYIPNIFKNFAINYFKQFGKPATLPPVLKDYISFNV